MNSNKLNFILNIVKVALVVIGVGISIFLFTGPNVTAGTEEVEAFRDGSKMSAAIYFTIAVLLALVAMVFIFFFVQLASNPKKTIISIIGLIIALGIYLIFFAMGTSDTSDSLLLKNPVDKSTVVTTTAGLFTVLLGLGIGLIVILAGPLIGRFRK